MDNYEDIIKEQIENNPVVLYMKGNPDFPRCGFSALAVKILEESGVTSYASFDVSSDAGFKEAVKQFSNWPTFPQLYIGGELIGGCDVMKEMFESGELEDTLAAVE